MSQESGKFKFHKNKNEFFLTLEGVFSSFYFVLTQTAIFTAVAIYFGLNEVWLGLAASFPMAFQIFQLFAPAVIEKFSSKKMLLAFFNSGRFLWVVLLPFLFVEQRSPKLFIAVFALSQIFAAFAGNIWVSMISDMIPEERRGKYLGLRNFFVSLSTLSVFYLFSVISDNVKIPFNFLLIILITLFGSFLALLTLMPLEERRATKTGTVNDLKLVLADKNFMKLSKAYFAWNFVVLLAAPFFPYHQLHNLKLPMTYISYASITASVLSMVFYTIWGKLSDEFGHKSVLIAGLSIVSITPAIWILMNERDWILALALDAVLSGVGWAAVNLAFITLPMETASSNSPMYFAVFSALGGLGGMIGSLVGGPLASFFNSFDFYIGDFHIYGLQIFFIMESALRYSVIPLFAKISSRKYVSLPTLFTNVLSILSGRHVVRIHEGNRSDVIIGRKRISRWW
ncbi:MFS transporter [Fervidobacterium pennivorans subsp. shakshaketiis]|jgi:MFS family permease|uniref:MFS transporter n=1 Tax=Fervidobacterium pennivorans TaxID=93466 RepID=UPI00355B57E2